MAYTRVRYTVHSGACHAGALLSALQQGLLPGAPFWAAHDYHSREAPFFSYCYDPARAPSCAVPVREHSPAQND